MRNSPDSPDSMDDPPASARLQVVLQWLRASWPAPLTADRTERVRVVVGAILGIGITALASQWAGEILGATTPWMVAPLGASAVLVFGVPASPLAQPWPVIGGNTLAALAGVACVHVVHRPDLAAALAVGLAVGLMFACRCLHPPGGASALLVALSGVTDPTFALYPVLANSVLLVATGMVYNRVTRRAYPHPQLQPERPCARDDELGAMEADLDAVLARYNQVLDVSRDDLMALLQDAHLRAYQRKLARLRCRDIMSTDVVSVRPATSLHEAWALFRRHKVKALPVVDTQGGVVGIVTPADFLRLMPDRGDRPFENSLTWLRPSAAGEVTSPRQDVSEIMSRNVCVANDRRLLSELVPLFGGTGHHHVPIVNDQGCLVGMLAQSDVVSALARAATEAQCGPGAGKTTDRGDACVP